MILLFPSETLRADLIFASTNLERIALQPHRNRIDAEAHGEVVEDSLHAERCDRMPRRAHRTRLAGVHRDAALLHAGRANLVDVGSGECRASASSARIDAGCETRRAEGGQFERGQVSLRIAAELDLLERRRPVAHRDRLLAARQYQFHGGACHLRKARAHDSLDPGGELGTEPAAHVLANDAHLALRNSQRARECAPAAKHRLR